MNTAMNMAVTLPLGVTSIVILFLLFNRFTPLTARHNALVLALVSLAVYFPYTLWFWPGVDVMVMNLTLFLMTCYVLGLVFSHREQVRASGVRGKWFHWGPASIIAFFMVILAVDGVFVTLSIEGLPGQRRGETRTVFPGVVYNHYYKKESRYNAFMRQMEDFRARGWTLHKGWVDGHARAGREAVLQVVIRDAQDRKVGGLQIGGRFLRPSDSRQDVIFTMRESAPGVYQAGVTLAQPGHWDLLLEVQDEQQRYELRASTTIDGVSESGPEPDSRS